MNLVNKEVGHKTFGKGKVVNYDDSYVKIKFESGTKDFIFPDVFGKHVTLVDQRAANLVREVILKKEEERKKEALKLKKEKALERERQHILEQKRRMRNRKIHPRTQSVFWCKSEEEDTIFTEWRVFIGKIKSGERKGQPRRLARMNQNSACLLTRREPDMPEEDRLILGAYMSEEALNGKLREDGYIPAHSKYRVHLSEQESKKMFFWNYYFDRRFPNRMIWNSGRQRYFDNIWMAQILRDIVNLKKENPQELKDAQLFYEYFCKINCINKDKLPKPNGALMRIKNN